MLLAIDAIHANGNLRRAAASPEQDAALDASLRALGQLQPILVRYDDTLGGHVLVAGHRRLEAMRRIGRDEIEAHVVAAGEKIATGMQAAENMVRLDMDPVDQWRAVRRLLELDYPLLQAGQMLGLTDSQTRRLHKLSGMAEPLLEALRGHPLPGWRHLGIIAAAPHEKQLEAFERLHPSYGDHVGWRLMADACVVARIPQARAIFDVETAGVGFEEDLFAEPGSEAQFTTADIAGFMAAQDQALQATVAAAIEPSLIVAYDPAHGQPKPPKGYIWSDGVHGMKTLPKKGKHKRLYAIVPASEGHSVGRVIRAVVEPVAQATPAAKQATQSPAAAAVAEPDADEADGDERGTAVDRESGRRITKAGQVLLAQARTEALRAAVRDPGLEPRAMLALLVLAFAAENVEVVNGPVGRSHADLAAALLTPGGDLVPIEDDDWIVHLAGELLARVLLLRPEEDQRSTYRRGSGAAAEWIGRAVGADQLMPRIDTVEMLACVGAQTLIELAAQANVKATGKTAELRARLVGQVRVWNPVPFGAPGPSVEPWRLDAPDTAEESDA